MALQTVTVAPLMMRMHINYQICGWEEDHFLTGNDIQAALAVARNICLFRRAMLGVGCELVFASLMSADNLREAFQVFDGVYRYDPRQEQQGDWVDGTPYKPNSPRVGFMYRYETPIGRWGNKIIRGIPDAWVQDFRERGVQFAAAAVGSPNIVLATSTNAGLTNYINSFLAYLRDNTIYAKKLTPNEQNPVQYQIDTWARVLSRKVGEKKVGKPFGVPVGRAYLS